MRVSVGARECRGMVMGHLRRDLSGWEAPCGGADSDRGCATPQSVARSVIRQGLHQLQQNPPELSRWPLNLLISF